MTILEKDLAHILNNRVISGVGEGEKIMLLAQTNHLIFLCDNFALAGKIKRGLEGLGKKAEIVSNARESEDEKDKNLLPFIESLNKFLTNKIDVLIFLPCSMIVKFDLAKFKPIKLKKDG